MTARDGSGQFSVELLLNEGAPEQLRLPIGGTLRTGDRFALRLSDIEPLYFYAEQQSASGAATVLYPPAGAPAAATEVSTPLVLPTGGTFQLDDHTGKESIWVVASRTALTADAARGEIARAATGGTTDREPPPTSSTAGGRPGEVLWGGLDSRGVGVVRFRLVHQ